MPDSTGEKIPDWTALWAKAAAATAGRSPFDRVYTGPVWESTAPAGPGDPRFWKIAVLERRPGSGAEHWGHLFVIVAGGAAGTSLRPESGRLGDPDRPDIEFLPTIARQPFRVGIRPTSTDTAERLRAFAVEFERRVGTLSLG